MSPEKTEYDQEEIHDTTSNTRELSYSKNFKEIISRNPHAISIVLKLINQIQDQFQSDQPLYPDRMNEVPSYEDRGIRVTLSPVRMHPADFFRVDIEDKSFFVKKKGPKSGGGTHEMKSLRSVADKIKEIKGVKVVTYKLGYSDKFGNHYFVSEWLNYPRLKEYIEKLDDSQKSHDLQSRIVELESKLNKEFIDVASYNMLYNPTDDTIYLFDIDLREN